MSDSVIVVDRVSKTFRLPHEKNSSIKNMIVNFWRRDKGYENQIALSDISFEIKKGDFFGIVGRNGSGKSTLLKMLAGTYIPTAGSIHVSGSLTPFIELGVGFNPELTGRENVFLNGALLGFARKDMLAMYEDIVEFAELERFMDQKLKNYSSGMQVRLAFSIAVRARSDILLLDEVLAVGDEAFQRKCYEYFTQLKKEKKTVVLVTHDMGAVKNYCNKALMIENSKIIAIGKPREIALKYERANAEGYKSRDLMNRPNDPPIQIDDLRFTGVKSKLIQANSDRDLSISVDLVTKDPSLPVQLNMYITKADGTYLAGINTVGDLGKKNTLEKGKKTIELDIQGSQLPPGEYVFNVGVYTIEKKPKLIDIFDTSYGTDNPRLIITDGEASHDGLFYIKAKWKKRK